MEYSDVYDSGNGVSEQSDGDSLKRGKGFRKLIIPVIAVAVCIGAVLLINLCSLKHKLSGKAWYQKEDPNDFLYFASDGTFFDGGFDNYGYSLYEVWDKGTWSVSGNELTIESKGSTIKMDVSINDGEIIFSNIHNDDGDDIDGFTLVYDRRLTQLLSEDLE